MQRVTGSGLRRDHQPNGPEFSPQATVDSSCFHPDGVSVGPNSNCGSQGWIPLTRSIPHSLSTSCKDCRGKGAEGDTSAGSTNSTRPGSACVSGGSGLVGRVLHAADRRPRSQRGGLNLGRDGWMEHILNPPLDRKERSYFDILLLPESPPPPTPEQYCIYY